MKSAIKEEFKGIAARVAEAAARKAPGSAGASITPRASNRGAAIAFGGRKEPHFPWLDFGGSVGRGHMPGVPWSGAIKRDWRGNPTGSGRYIYPTISEHREDTRDAVDDAIERLAKRASFTTRGSV